MATVDTKKITLRTADDQEFQVDEAVAMEFGTVRSFFDDNPDASSEPIPLLNVSSKCLSTLIGYCKSRVDFRASKAPEEETDAHNEEFAKSLDNEAIKETILAANYLNMKDLLDMLNQAVADRIKNKSVEYVRKFFGVENDYTPEEEAAVRAEHEWAHQDINHDDWANQDDDDDNHQDDDEDDDDNHQDDDDNHRHDDDWWFETVFFFLNFIFQFFFFKLKA